MASIYISSTFSDLKDYRDKSIASLRKAGYSIVAMEDYVATGKYPPLKKCLDDVENCDYYVGIFAWRYGYIPGEDNPAQKSITELEYRRACETDKPRFIFLLDTDADWSPKAMDIYTGEGNRGECIRTLREELGRDKLASFFRTPDELANLVIASVNRWEQGESERQSDHYVESNYFEDIKLDAQLIESLNKSLKLAQEMKNNGILKGNQVIHFKQLKQDSQEFIRLNERLKELDKRAKDLVSELRERIDLEGQIIAQEIAQNGYSSIDSERMEVYEELKTVIGKFEQEFEMGREISQWLKKRSKEFIDDSLYSLLRVAEEDTSLAQYLEDEIQVENLKIEADLYLKRVAFALSLGRTNVLDNANGLNGFPKKIYRIVFGYIKNQKIQKSSGLIKAQKDLINYYIDHLVDHVF